jgi:hypothetical protein
MKKTELLTDLQETSKRNCCGEIEIVYRFPKAVTYSGESTICCAKSYEKLFGLSSKTRVKIVKSIKFGVVDEENEVSELKSGVGEARRHHALLWMKNEFSILCDFLPTSDYTKKDHHLPKCVSKASIFAEYELHFKDLEDKHGQEFKPFSIATFLRLWRENYPYVTVPDHTAFSVCEVCANLHDKILFATKSKDRKMLVELKKLRRIHLQFIAEERLHYREHQRLARDTDDHECICVDGMDQAKLRGPHFAGRGIPKSTSTFYNKIK